MRHFSTLKVRLLTLFAVIGPGIIAANADNDAGGISTLTVVGARYGYQLLFVLFLITIALAVTQEMGARIGIVTGKGLGGVIREKFGVRATMLAMAVMLIANLGVTVANIAGIAEAMRLIGISKYLAVPFFLTILWLILYKFTYDKVEKIFLALSALYVVYIITAFQTRPDWGEAVTALVTPHLRFDTLFLYTMMALIGTTITPWGQFFIQSYVVDKGVHVKNYLYSKIEVLSGALVTDIVSFFIIVTAANTLYLNGVEVTGAADAAQALAPLAGGLANVLFAVGLLNASLLGAFVVPLATAYALSEVFGFESGIDHNPAEARTFYTALAVMIVLSGLIVLIPGLSLFPLIITSQLLNALLLPFILIYVYKIANDRRVMGTYANGPVWNAVTLVTIVGLIVASAFVLYGSLTGRV
jgi:Mn2+/Fe2+ NRAMP family transporter